MLFTGLKSFKKLFPRTPICLLFDGLYACEKVFEIFLKNNWDLIIVFKPKKISNLYREAVKAKEEYLNNQIVVKTKMKYRKFHGLIIIPYRKLKMNIIFSNRKNLKKLLKSQKILTV